MALPQQKLREIVLQLLYTQEFVEDEFDEKIQLIMHELKISKKSALLAAEKAIAVQKKREEIDPMIQKVSSEYQLERIALVERNIIRLAIHEMLISKDVPPKVVIAEAIRLARKFATPEAANYVNAILDALYVDKKEPSLTTA